MRLLLILLVCLVTPTFAADKKDAAKNDSAAPVAAATTTKTTCRADVSYSWKRVPPPPPKDPAGAKEPPPKQEESPPEDVFFQQARDEGDGKESAEQALHSRLPEIESRARERCSSVHENQGSCLALKLRSLGEDFTKLDFDSRKMVRDQIMLDCSRGSGICLGTKHSEVLCTEEKPKEVAAEAPADAKKEKKK